MQPKLFDDYEQLLLPQELMDYAPGFLSIQESDHLLQLLQETVPWQQHKVTISGPDRAYYWRSGKFCRTSGCGSTGGRKIWSGCDSIEFRFNYLDGFIRHHVIEIWYNVLHLCIRLLVFSTQLRTHYSQVHSGTYLYNVGPHKSGITFQFVCKSVAFKKLVNKLADKNWLLDRKENP